MSRHDFVTQRKASSNFLNMMTLENLINQSQEVACDLDSESQSVHEVY